MKLAEQIRNTIVAIPESQPFGYADLGIEAGDFFTAAKALDMDAVRRSIEAQDAAGESDAASPGA